MPTFVAPDVAKNTAVSFTLNVTDSGSLWDTDTVTITVQSNPLNDFVTVWGTSAAYQNITIPVGGSTATYTIDWGDGAIEEGVTGDGTHNYTDAGRYTVRISGDFERIYLGGDAADNAENLRSIEQWGPIEWSSMAGAFQNARNMEYNAVDTPNLSGVADTSYMFHLASSFNGNISQWDVSSVTDMSRMFANTPSFDQPLNDWNVSSVTNMSGIFSNAAYSQSLSNWDVSSVTDMSEMFYFTPL